ncbi:hypothetical protein I5907_06190 [Panacibacter sp. DH6]|uniref:Uncharacterized protein n=1 Tax=Panacibacter microcysteis TaxID=2793269 RepID=A0A931E5D2_9BACT|nr:hypothetical protein [Panacibacter microcysteis]MBG9375816.1 hypothetical protein [Panacibacter microcysteis]
MQKEILLLTGTSFVKKECSQAARTNADESSHQQMLEDACWNGRLPEILPEVLNDLDKSRQLYLWLIRQGEAYIQLELCEEPLVIDREFSLDPYLFLSAHINN